MQVRPRRTAGRTDRADHVAFDDEGAHLGVDLRQVRVVRAHTFAVVDDDVAAVAALQPRIDNDPRRAREDRGAADGVEVDA